PVANCSQSALRRAVVRQRTKTVGQGNESESADVSAARSVPSSFSFETAMTLRGLPTAVCLLAVLGICTTVPPARTADHDANICAAGGGGGGGGGAGGGGGGGSGGGGGGAGGGGSAGAGGAGGGGASGGSAGSGASGGS